MYSSVLLSPILVLAGTAAASAATARAFKIWAGGVVAIAGAIYCLVWALGVPVADVSGPGQELGTWVTAPGLRVQLSFLADRVSTMSMIPLLSGVLIALVYSTVRDLAGDSAGWQYYPLQILSLAGLLATMLGANLVLVCAGWGVFIVTGYSLLATYGLRPGIRSGAGSFLAIGTIAGFALLGACTLLVRFGGGELDWAAIPQPAFRSEFFWLFGIALLAMTAQYPFHGLFSRAAASIYPQVSLIVSVGPVMTALYLFLRVQMLSTPGSGLPLSGVFLLFGAITATGGAILALTNDSPSAVAGFSNASLSGFAMLAMGTGTAMGTSALLFIMACLPLLLVATALGAKPKDERAGETTAISHLTSHRSGFHRISGHLLVALAAGLPFGAGFVVRWLVVAALVDAGSLVYAAVAFLASVLTMAAVLKTVAAGSDLPREAVARGWGLRASNVLFALLSVLLVVSGSLPLVLSSLFVDRVGVAVLGGSGSLISGSLVGLGLGGEYMYGFVGAVAVVLFLAGGLGLWLLRFHSVGSAGVFAGGSATPVFAVPGEGLAAFPKVAPVRFAWILLHVLEPNSLYRTGFTIWHRFTMPLRIIFYVVEERYYMGAVFLFVLGVFLLIMR